MVRSEGAPMGVGGGVWCLRSLEVQGFRVQRFGFRVGFWFAWFGVAWRAPPG